MKPQALTEALVLPAPSAGIDTTMFTPVEFACRHGMYLTTVGGGPALNLPACQR
jgi:hypothetical protein